MSDDPQAKLRELLESLADYRRELELAEKRGDEGFAAIARRLLNTQLVTIRRHCAMSRLPLPADVPEED